MFNTYVDVVCNLPLANVLTYRVPENLIESIKPGQRLQVMLRNRSETAIALKIHKIDPGFETLEIISLLDREAILIADQIELGLWMADYYLSTHGLALFKMFPKHKKWPAKSKKNPTVNFFPDHTLNKSQNLVYLQIKKQIQSRSFGLHLLHGITGSGKTEIYIHCIIEALAQGRTAILIVPEITLTVQLVKRLTKVFGGTLGLLHSALSNKQRLATYVDILHEKKQIVVGTRSAIFAPLRNPGIIIIDEEHDSSFKEHSAPRYDARQVAVKRAMMSDAIVVMGSATPRIESFYLVRNNNQKNYYYHRLKTRATGANLATIEILKQKSHDIPLTGKMLAAIEKNFKKKEKTLLLLNRRGYNPTVICMGCEEIEKCPYCAVSMNLHRNGRLICHYCGYKRLYDGLCSCAKKAPLKPLGSGTQKLEEYLLNLMPDLRLERLDTDLASRRGYAESSIQRLLDGEIDVLIGTQMIAKGLDVPEVTLVGVLQADAGLSMPDFRSAEKTFSLLTQVAGRSGRGKNPGIVIFECYAVDDPVVQFASKQDYFAFCEAELNIRRQMVYPPFCRLIRLVVRGKSESKVISAIEELAKLLKQELTTIPDQSNTVVENIQLLGPVRAPLEKLHNQYRYHIIIKVPARSNIKPGIRRVMDSFHPAGVFIEIDIDPVDLL